MRTEQGVGGLTDWCPVNHEEGVIASQMGTVMETLDRRMSSPRSPVRDDIESSKGTGFFSVGDIQKKL